MVLFGIGYLVALFLISSLNSFIDEAPKYYKRFDDILSQISGALNSNFAMELPANPMAELDLTTTFIGSINAISQNFLSFASALVIIILSTIFLLLEAPFLQVTIAKAFPRKTGKQIVIIMRHTTKQIGRYLSIKFVVSVFTGILVWFFLQIIGMDFALIWGVMAFILNFIPNIGSVIVMVVTIVMGFIQFFPQPGPIIAVFASMIGVQIVFGNFFEPRLQGRRLNLSPILIIFSLFLWGWVWGPVGMFIAIPITAVIKIICYNIPGLKPLSMLMENGRRVLKYRKKSLKVNKPKP
jgi:predicted PurR-regulated permease PerM